MPDLQLALPLAPHDLYTTSSSCQEKLAAVLDQDLDFHDRSSQYASHNFHSFPAKFPPQLPAKFIAALTQPGDLVLDPMTGSGTTVLEAILAGRRAIGLDIDPLALMISRVKASPLNPTNIQALQKHILHQARQALDNQLPDLAEALDNRWDSHTREFIDYWFTPDTQLELIALIREVEKTPDPQSRAFFLLAFSAIIITKSGGVSLALDLGHTRPHRAKIVYDQSNQIIAGHEFAHAATAHNTKRLRSAFDEFEKRCRANTSGILHPSLYSLQPAFSFSDAQRLPLANNSIDLIVTSPPYASNAIDYMRAHKFSLAWMGHSIHHLGIKRDEYIGSEATTTVAYETLPPMTAQIVSEITALDKKKGLVVHRYYSEMTRVLQEMHRVLKPGKAAVVVVGTSIMRGRDTQTQACLAEIGTTIGFAAPKIGVRHLDRDRRMMPVGANTDKTSQIQQRMHEEYVIGFYKPDPK
jgi:DNA modification methylase